MDHTDLIAFREMVGLSQSKMSKALGYSIRQYQKMEADEVEIKHCVGMACAAYALGIREYNGPSVRMAWNKRKEQ